MLQKKINVVIIDDDKDDFQTIQYLLNEVKDVVYEIEWISDSSSAIATIELQKADIYLLDFQIDERNAFDILDALTTSEVKNKIILLTGADDHRLDITAMEKGASDFLNKNELTSPMLERAIRYCLKRSLDLERLKEAERFRFLKDKSDSENQAKSQFMANLSHEIRTPLHAIIGFTDIALDPTSGDQDKDEFLKIIKRNGEHLLELINNVLEISKIEAGHIQIRKESFNWKSQIHEVIELLMPGAVSKSLYLDCETPDHLPDFVVSDRQRFRQIIINLMSNAIKFTFTGAVTLKIYLQKNSQTSEGNLCFSIQDTGVGINKVDQENLFQAFHQSSSGINSKVSGSGLGLNLSRKLAKALGGNVELATSQPDVGSCFLFAIPAQFSSAESIPNLVVKKYSFTSKNSMTPLNVLLVEDSKDNQTLIQHFLKDDSFQVQIANNGRIGIQKAIEIDFDIILMDIQMPEMDGFEVTQSLRRQGYAKPIIALSAHALAEDQDRALKNGFSDYIVKPVAKQNLIKALNKYRKTEVSIAAHF